MGEIGAQKCPLNVIGDPEADVKKIGATSNLSKFCGSNLVLFGAISLLSVVAQQRLSILKVSCRNYTTRLLGSGCGPKKGVCRRFRDCGAFPRQDCLLPQRSAKRHLTWSSNIQPYAKAVRQRGGSMRGFKAARCSAMQLKCGRIEKAGPRVETQHSALQMVCVSYLTQAGGKRNTRRAKASWMMVRVCYRGGMRAKYCDSSARPKGVEGDFN